MYNNGAKKTSDGEWYKGKFLVERVKKNLRSAHHTMMPGRAACEKAVHWQKYPKAGVLSEKNQERSFNDAGFLERPSSWETWVATSSMDLPAVETMGIWWL